MATTGIVRRSKKQQRIAAELGGIIYEMGQAMWNANKKYIALSSDMPTYTLAMESALYKFKFFCEEHYGK